MNFQCKHFPPAGVDYHLNMDNGAVTAAEGVAATTGRATEAWVVAVATAAETNTNQRRWCPVGD